MTCPNHASFCLLTVVRGGPCGPTRKLILLRTQWLVLCSKQKMQKNVLVHLVLKAWILFFRVSKQGPCFTATANSKQTESKQSIASIRQYLHLIHLQMERNIFRASASQPIQKCLLNLLSTMHPRTLHSVPVATDDKTRTLHSCCVFYE